MKKLREWLDVKGPELSERRGRGLVADIADSPFLLLTKFPGWPHTGRKLPQATEMEIQLDEAPPDDASWAREVSQLLAAKEWALARSFL